MSLLSDLENVGGNIINSFKNTVTSTISNLTHTNTANTQQNNTYTNLANSVGQGVSNYVNGLYKTISNPTNFANVTKTISPIVTSTMGNTFPVISTIGNIKNILSSFPVNQVKTELGKDFSAFSQGFTDPYKPLPLQMNNNQDVARSFGSFTGGDLVGIGSAIQPVIKGGEATFNLSKGALNSIITGLSLAAVNKAAGQKNDLNSLGLPIAMAGVVGSFGEVGDPEINKILGVPEKAQLSSEAIREGIVKPTKGSHINIGTQLSRTFEDPTIPTTQDAIAKRFEIQQNITQRANTTAQIVDKAVNGKLETRLFRNAIEHPSNLELNATKVKDPEAFTNAVKSFSDFTDYVYTQTRENNIDIGYLKDYYSHILDLTDPKMAAKFEDYVGTVSKNGGYYSKQRIFKNIEELQARGFKLKNPNAPLDITQYGNTTARNIGNEGFLNVLNKANPGGVVQIDKAGGIPRDETGRPFIPLKIIGLENTAVSPDIYKHVKHLETANEPNSFIGLYDKVNSMGKNLELAGGGFHGLKTTFRAIGNDLLDFRFPRIDKAFVNSISDSARRNYREQAMKDGTISKASRMGVTLDTVPDIGSTDELAKIKSKNPLELMHKSLFGGLINTYKLEMVRNSNINNKTPEEARQIGAEINNIFGGLNQQLIHRSPTTQAWLRRVTLAPDFNEGKIRSLSSAINLSRWDSGAIRARKGILGEALAVGIATEIARRLVTGNFSPNLQSALKNDVLSPNVPLPYKSPSGRQLNVDVPGSIITDLQRAIADPTHFMENRGGFGVSTATKLISGQDYYGNQLVDPFRAPDNAINRIKALIPTSLPIPVAEGYKVAQGKENLTTAGLNISGLRVHTSSEDPVSKYFSIKDHETSTLNPNQEAIYNTLHPITKDSKGNKVVAKSPLSKQQKAILYIDNPDILAVDNRINHKLAGNGENIDPFWNLNMPAQKIVLVTEAGLPGQTSADNKIIYQQNPWLEQFNKDRAKFYDSLPKSDNTSTRPIASDYVQKQMDNKNWNDPQVKEYLDKNTQYTNDQRAQIGLPPKPTINFNYKSFKKPSMKKLRVKAPKLGKAVKFKAPKLPKLTATKFKGIKPPKLVIKPVRSIYA